MAPYSDSTLQQLRNVTKEQFCKALERFGYVRQTSKGKRGRKGSNRRTYRHPELPSDRNKVIIHWHAKEIIGPKLSDYLLSQTQWSEDDLARLKLIKKKGK